MQISASVLALLAIPAARAIPISSAGNHLAVRGVTTPGQASEISLLARNLSPKARGLAASQKSIYARYAHIKDDGERSVAVVRDLQRRGIIDTLVQALAAILTELLGTDGAPARHYRRQLTVLGMQTGSIVDDITCLILKLVGINDSNCAGKPTKRDVSAAANSFTGLNAADPVAMRESLGDLLSQVGRALEKEEFEGDISLVARDAGATTELLERQFPATLGVEGLLSVLRELLDAVLNTLLPLSPRSAVASPTASAPRATGTNCPPPGTPNDGMYRPGCPGYGRRELSELSARDSEQLENMAPMLEMLIQKLEPLVQKADDAAATDSSSSSSTDPASTSSAATGDAAASSTTDGSESSAVDGALAQLSSSASTPGPSSSAPGGAAAASGAAPTVAARDFLGADGFQYVKRQATAAANDDSDSDSASASSTSSSASPSSTTETSASYSMVKGVVSELVSMFTGGDSGSSSSKTSSATTDSGSSSADSGSSSSFMNLMTNVLGGLSSRSVSADHPVLARHHVEHLLDRAVGTSPGQKMLRRLASPYIERAVDMTNSVINARADFAPVWNEAKKLGNAHFGQLTQRSAGAANDGSVQNVWSSFSKLVDDSFAANGKASKRSPSPAVDVKPFEDAVVQWARKHLAQDGAKAKRDLQQFQPLAQAAGKFAKQQMKEWTVALNEHNGSQKA